MERYLLRGLWFGDGRSGPNLWGQAFTTPGLVPFGYGAGCSGACPADPPAAEIFIAVGSMQGNVTLHVGLIDATPDDAADEVAGRDPIPVLPDAWGRGGAGGTYVRTVEADGTTTQRADGRVQATLDQRASGPHGIQVQQTLRLRSDAEFATDGLLALEHVSRTTAGVQTFRHAIQFPGGQVAEEGAWADPVPRYALPDAGLPARLANPNLNAHWTTGVGSFEAVLDRSFTGAEPGHTDTVRFSWAWVDRDLLDHYEWPRSASIAPGAASPLHLATDDARTILDPTGTHEATRSTQRTIP